MGGARDLPPDEAVAVALFASPPDGYEASFVALDGNPLDDFASVRRVAFRFKQGHLICLTNPGARKTLRSSAGVR